MCMYVYIYIYKGKKTAQLPCIGLSWPPFGSGSPSTFTTVYIEKNRTPWIVFFDFSTSKLPPFVHQFEAKKLLLVLGAMAQQNTGRCPRFNVPV